MIAITFALPAESSDLRKKWLREAKVSKIADTKIIHGKISTTDVAVVHTGVGRKACEHHLENFFRTFQPKTLISSGFAGALSLELQVGDVIVGENFSDRTLAEKFVNKVRLFSANSIVDSAADRSRLATETGAAAIDMETEAISRACAKHGVPMLSLRAISDTPSAPFPLPPRVLFNVNRQKTDFAKLLGTIVRHPGNLFRLVRFSRQIKQARARLTEAIVKVLGEL